MSTNQIAAQVTLARLVLAADAGRAAGPAGLAAAEGDVGAAPAVKLPDWLRDRLSTGLSEVERLGESVDNTEGNRKQSSGALKTAYRSGERAIRDVSTYLNGLPRTVDRGAARTRYGLGSGVGRMTTAIIESRLAAMLHADKTVPAEMKLRPDLRAALQQSLDGIADNRPTAQQGTRQQAVAERNAAQATLEDGLRRARYHLYATLPGGDTDPELVNYGFDPRTTPARRSGKSATA